MRLFVDRHFSIMYLSLLRAFLETRSDWSDSRLGSVHDLGPVAFELDPEGSRFCILRKRRFNPFFALAEMSWVLAGDNRLAPLTTYLPRFREFSDDGETLTGAYGYRLRSAFGRDQLIDAGQMLSRDPTTRRVVLSFWDAADLAKDSLDIPCNTTVFLKIRKRRLDMMVCNRSNDVFLGVPYNVITFAGLQAAVAIAVGVRRGTQIHVTDSLHLYEKDYRNVEKIVALNDVHHLESVLGVLPQADIEDYAKLDHACLVENPAKEIEAGVCGKIRNSFIAWRTGSREVAVRELPPSDVGLAALEWFRASQHFKREWEPKWARNIE